MDAREGLGEGDEFSGKACNHMCFQACLSRGHIALFVSAFGRAKKLGVRITGSSPLDQAGTNQTSLSAGLTTLTLDWS